MCIKHALSLTLFHKRLCMIYVMQGASDHTFQLFFCNLNLKKDVLPVLYKLRLRTSLHYHWRRRNVKYDEPRIFVLHFCAWSYTIFRWSNDINTCSCFLSSDLPEEMFNNLNAQANSVFINSNFLCWMGSVSEQQNCIFANGNEQIIIYEQEKNYSR